MSRDTFAFTSASLRSLRLEQEHQDWEDARRSLAQRRALVRRPLPPAPRLRHGDQKIQTLRAPPPQTRCRDPAVHNTFMCGSMSGIYALLKDPGMVNALMETVHEEMLWAPEMGMWTLTSKIRQTLALRLAASRGHCGCVEELLFRGAEVDAEPGGRTALHDACWGGHHACVRLLLDHGADPDRLSEDGTAPLHLCNTPHTYQCAEQLLVSGACVNVTQRDLGLTPLHVACRRGLEDHVNLFLSRGADVSARTREGETPLNAACAGAERPADHGRFLRVAQTLLRGGADALAAGRKSHTPLHNACGNCCSRLVRLLLEHGAQADAHNAAGYTPMDCLLQALEDYPDQQPEVVAQSLLNYGAEAPSVKTLRLCSSSPATLEVMLNCFPAVPSSLEWLEDVSEHLVKDAVRRMSGQPRSLQHLCRCSLRRHLGALCHLAIHQLRIPGALKEYLLLAPDGRFR